MNLDDLSHQDALWTDRLLRNLELLQAETLARNDIEQRKVIVNICRALVVTYQLLIAYRRSPSGGIDGKRGVAQQLRLTREQIFVRLDMFGYTPLDFHDPDATLSGLLQKSSLAPDIELVQQSDGEYYKFAHKE
ncbi:MAG: hypothetical protein PHX87_06470 [Candidatus Peribacteraceae bacterium]|nr:hypothetical protein [Candidatus Peribacteraceae bacterium]MDD5743033.1 hypothetical protein [Candidatus Peribacteraceae bacterium]